MHRGHGSFVRTKYVGARAGGTGADGRIANPHCTHRNYSDARCLPRQAASLTVRRANRASRRCRVEALWAIRRIGAPTLSPDGASACAAGDVASTWTNNESTHRAVAVPDGLRRGKSRGAKRATPDRGRQGQRSANGRPTAEWIAFTAKRKDDEEPQVYLIAPDGGEARRLTTLATGCSRAQMVCRRQADRVRLLGVAGSRHRRRAGEAQEGAEGREGQGARHRARANSASGTTG